MSVALTSLSLGWLHCLSTSCGCKESFLVLRKYGWVLMIFCFLCHSLNLNWRKSIKETGEGGGDMKKVLSQIQTQDLIILCATWMD